MEVLKSLSIYFLPFGCLFGIGERGMTEEPKGEIKETRVVLRISREFIRNHAIPSIEEVTAINMCRFGAHVTGTAKTTGQTTINMVVRERDAVFTFHFKGTTLTKTVATKHPVAIYSSGRTDFVAQREIHFDGVLFSHRPATIEATYCSTIDCLATPPRLIGRIARAKAIPEIQRLKPASDALDLSDTKTQVLAAFDRESEKLVTDLNKVAPWEQTINLLVPRTKEWITHVSSTSDYLMASPGPKDSTIPVLPKEFLSMKAPLELWIHGQPVGDPSRKIVESWSTVQRGLDRFRGLVSGKEAKVEGVSFTAVGEWWVLKVGEDLLERWVEKLVEKKKE